jgi:hypothetical protein
MAIKICKKKRLHSQNGTQAPVLQINGFGYREICMVDM